MRVGSERGSALNQKGLLTAWNDTKGFGLITPEGGGEWGLAHICSYAGRGRPVSDRKVIYSLTKNDLFGIRRGRAAISSFSGLQPWPIWALWVG